MIKQSVEKDRRARIPEIAAVRFLLDEASSGDAKTSGPVSVGVKAGLLRRSLPWAVAGTLGVGLATALGLWAPWRNAPPLAPLHLEATLGGDASLANTGVGASAILSPDGQMLAFVARKMAGATSQLYVRRLDQLKATPLSGTDEASSPFFSPDGQWIAFFAGGKLKKISVSGGAAVTLCDASNPRGGIWAEDGTIVFQPIGTAGGNLMRVSGPRSSVTRSAMATSRISSIVSVPKRARRRALSTDRI